MKGKDLVLLIGAAAFVLGIWLAVGAQNHHRFLSIPIPAWWISAGFLVTAGSRLNWSALR